MTVQTAPQMTKSEQRYRRLFETAQDGILILNFPAGEIQDANPFLIDMLGYGREELIGKELWQIGAFIDKEASIAAFRELSEKKYIRYDDLPLRKKNGQILNVEFISNVYQVANDDVVQCNIRDISDRKLAEQKALEYQAAISMGMYEIVDTLSTLIAKRDPYTAGHQLRVSELAAKIAAKLNLPIQIIEGIRLSALIHDIGKIVIPAEILTKPTKLTDYEMAMVRSHVQAGYDILKHLHFPWPVGQIVLQHHERLDGSGYPNHLKGDSICQEARIIAVADCVEAMSGNRPYRMALGIDAALKMITDNKGKLFDPAVTQACLTVFNQDKFSFPPH